MEEREVLELVDMLYTMVSEAWGVPLGNDRCIVEREKVLGLLDEIKHRLPNELAEAKLLVSKRDEYINRAKQEGDSIRKAAEEQARTMVDQQEIVRAARERSNAMLTNAENRTRELYKVVNAYVDEHLRNTEAAMTNALRDVHQARVSFQNLSGGQSAQPQNPSAPNT